MNSSWNLGNGALNALYDALRKRLNLALVEALSSRALPARVLEAGSGPAFASSIFRTRPGVALSVALDIDADALRAARRRDPALCSVRGDLRRLPFRAGAFDLVWNSSTLEHFDDPHAPLAEMTRAARRFVFVGVPNLLGPLGFQRTIAGTSAGVWIGAVFSRRGLVALLRRHGLRARRTWTYFFGFFVGALAQPDLGNAAARR